MSPRFVVSVLGRVHWDRAGRPIPDAIWSGYPPEALAKFKTRPIPKRDEHRGKEVWYCEVAVRKSDKQEIQGWGILDEGKVFLSGGAKGGQMILAMPEDDLLGWWEQAKLVKDTSGSSSKEKTG